MAETFNQNPEQVARDKMKAVYSTIILFSLFLAFPSCSSEDNSSEENQLAMDIVGAWSPVGFCNREYIFYSDGTFEYVFTSEGYTGRYKIINATTIEIIGEEVGNSRRVTIDEITPGKMIWTEKRVGLLFEIQFVRAETCGES